MNYELSLEQNDNYMLGEDTTKTTPEMNLFQIGLFNLTETFTQQYLNNMEDVLTVSMSTIILSSKKTVMI